MREAVKCGSRSVRGGLACLVAVAVSAATPSATAQLLFGRAPHEPRPPAPLDARLPLGAEQVGLPRPPGAGEPPACSPRRPVCVHREANNAEGSRALEWLQALEDAYVSVVDAVGAPAPLGDGARGGGPALDLYLAPGVAPLEVRLDPADPAADLARASAFCTVGSATLPRARAATWCVAEALAARLDAGETPHSRRALAEELWLATAAPASADLAALDDAQAHPERAVVARELGDAAEGGALLLDYLDATRGRGGPAGVALATYALAAAPGGGAAFRFTNEPDLADVLRATFGPTPSDVARFYADFTVARALVGSRDADGVWPTLAWLGDAAAVRFEWSVPFSSLPRRLAPARPVEPTGATYLWVTLDGDAASSSLAFQAEWEPPVSFRWALVLLGADGRVVRRVDVPYLEQETRVERIVSDLGGAAALLIAGTQLGGIGPTYPFDPDFEPYEPHGYAVQLSRQ